MQVLPRPGRRSLSSRFGGVTKQAESGTLWPIACGSRFWARLHETSSSSKAPFNSHGQTVFSNGKNYITRDIDGHNVTVGWKMFNRQGQRIGTYDADLNYLKD
ncbi:toxin C-terminal domain-containing protein [Micromonospora luteifusca]|uniref:toxin C-terminal domain-containing protein n=1 Tax=Micromonospora luteifusca TaxID=709860 RepID=UPI0033B62DDB